MLGIESLTGGLPLAVYKFLDRWLYVGQCLRDQLFFRTASPMSLTMNPDTRLKTQTPLPDEEQATKKLSTHQKERLPDHIVHGRCPFCEPKQARTKAISVYVRTCQYI